MYFANAKGTKPKSLQIVFWVYTIGAFLAAEKCSNYFQNQSE